MARQIVTSERVAEIANALVLEGQEPSIVAVQAQIGGGSYSTVKRYLDVWRQERAEAAASAPVNGGRFPHKSGVHRRHGTA